MYTLYLRHEDTILVTLCMDLPINTISTGEQSDSSIFFTISNVFKLMERLLFMLGLIIYITSGFFEEFGQGGLK